MDGDATLCLEGMAVGGGDVRRFDLEIGGGRPCFGSLWTSPANSEETGDGNRAVPAAARARWIAAAEGASGMLMGVLVPRCGLWSWLFFLDLVSLEAGCWSFNMVALVGDGSREVLGDAFGDAVRDEGAEARGTALNLFGFCDFGGDGDLWLCGGEDDLRPFSIVAVSFGLSAVVASSV